MIRKSPRIANRPRKKAEVINEAVASTTKRTRRRHRPFKSFPQVDEIPRTIEKKEKKRKARRKAYSTHEGELILASPSNPHFGLLQELHAPSPYRVLLVAIFCTQTRGSSAAPVLEKLFEKYPTYIELSEAKFEEVVDLIHCLGLFNIRARRIIQLAKCMLTQKPEFGVKYTRAGLKYPPTPVSHLPGLGPYALDSFRLFCPEIAGQDEWRFVRPSDKELLAYVRWRWSFEGVDYDPLPPPIDAISIGDKRG